MREAVESIGSEAEGGGNNIAAGARVPQGTEMLLIENLNAALEKQLHPKKEEKPVKPKKKEPKAKPKTSKTEKSKSTTAAKKPKAKKSTTKKSSK